MFFHMANFLLHMTSYSKINVVFAHFLQACKLLPYCFDSRNTVTSFPSLRVTSSKQWFCDNSNGRSQLEFANFKFMALYLVPIIEINWATLTFNNVMNNSI